MSSPNEALARRWFDEVWNQRHLATVHDLFVPDGVCHSEQGPLIGPDAFLAKVYEPFLDALPDFRVEIEGTLAVDDEVLVRWIGQGTHTGGGFGIPPSGFRVTFHGMTWIRFEAGRITEGRDCWNVGELIQALQGGPIPAQMKLERSPHPAAKPSAETRAG